MKIAPVRKTIYSLGVMRELMDASNRRYIEFLSQLDRPHSGLRQLEKISSSVRLGDRSHRGFNMFDGGDLDRFVAIARGEHRISGFRNSDLQPLLERHGGYGVAPTEAPPRAWSGQEDRSNDQVLPHALRTGYRRLRSEASRGNSSPSFC